MAETIKLDLLCDGAEVLATDRANICISASVDKFDLAEQLANYGYPQMKDDMIAATAASLRSALGVPTLAEIKSGEAVQDMG